MSPETTRVSLESTVDILIRRPEQQNCIQCKSKKENQKGSIFQKKWSKERKELVVDLMMIKSVILNQCYYSAGTTAVAAAAAATTAAAGGKDQRRHLNGQSIRQHPYPRT